MRRVLAVLALACVAAWSQTATGSIRGTTTDPSNVPFISNGVRDSSSEVPLDGGAPTPEEHNGGITDVRYAPTLDAIEEATANDASKPVQETARDREQARLLDKRISIP